MMRKSKRKNYKTNSNLYLRRISKMESDISRILGIIEDIVDILETNQLNQTIYPMMYLPVSILWLFCKKMLTSLVQFLQT